MSLLLGWPAPPCPGRRTRRGPDAPGSAVETGLSLSSPHYAPRPPGWPLNPARRPRSPRLPTPRSSQTARSHPVAGPSRPAPKEIGVEERLIKDDFSGLDTPEAVSKFLKDKVKMKKVLFQPERKLQAYKIFQSRLTLLQVIRKSV